MKSFQVRCKHSIFQVYLWRGWQSGTNASWGFWTKWLPSLDGFRISSLPMSFGYWLGDVCGFQGPKHAFPFFIYIWILLYMLSSCKQLGGREEGKEEVEEEKNKTPPTLPWQHLLRIVITLGLHGNLMFTGQIPTAMLWRTADSIFKGNQTKHLPHVFTSSGSCSWLM